MKTVCVVHGIECLKQHIQKVGHFSSGDGLLVVSRNCGPFVSALSSLIREEQTLHLCVLAHTKPKAPLYFFLPRFAPIDCAAMWRAIAP